MRRYLKAFLVLGFLCSITSFFLTLSALTLRDRFTTSLSSRRKIYPSTAATFPWSAFRPSSAALTARQVQLLEHAAKINMTKLFKCDLQTKWLDLTNVETTLETHAWRLIVPRWQSRPRTSRHFLSAVVRLRLYREDKARWTVAELKQWIHYQLWAGADHVYICNHFLSDDEKIAGALESYWNAGLITVIDWNRIQATPGAKDYGDQNTENQLGCYKYVKDKWGHLSTWMYTFDMDENPYMPNDHCEGFLSRFLENNDSGYKTGKVGVFLLQNYVLHGQGDRSRDIHYDRINRITPKPPNGNVKSIFRTNWTIEAGMHNAKLRKGLRVRPKPSKLRLLHYWGARKQQWGPDTKEMFDETVEFNDVRETIAVAIRHSLLTLGEFEAFSNTTGP